MKKYYIYEVPGVKIGCTQNPYFRVEIGQKYKDYKILEEHTCVYEASSREIELQKEKNYQVDFIPYYKTLKSQITTTHPNVRKKAAIAISLATKGKKKPNVSKKKKGVYMPWLYAEEVLKRRGFSRKEAITQLSLEGKVIRIWDSVSDASKELNINIGGISNNIHGRAKSAGGYKWIKN